MFSKQQEQTAYKNLRNRLKEERAHIPGTPEYLRAQRMSAVRDLQSQYPGFELDPTQICPVTNETFDIKTGKTVTEIQWLTPEQWAQRQADNQ